MWILGLKGLTKTMQDQMRVQKFMKTVANPDVQIRGRGEGGRPDLEIGGGGGAWPFEPQFGLKIRGTQAPSLDPPMGND